MKKKIVLLVGIVMVLAMITTILTLAFMQSNYGLKLANPTTINVYSNSTTATKTYTNQDKEYSEIIKLYNEMTEKTMLEQLFNREFLSHIPAEDTTEQAWYDPKKANGIYVEFIYSTPQKLIVSRDGDSRRLDIKALIFKVSSENNFQKTLIYYRTEDTYKTVDVDDETIYPLAIEANTRPLFRYITR